MIQDIKLASYIETYGTHWADVLPDNCPPEDVCIANEDVFYRFTLNEDSIVAADWQNHLTLFPDKLFSEQEQIVASGLSMMDELDAARKKMKLPGMKRFRAIAQISLVPEDGVILQTGCRIHHFTWWRTTMCNLTKARLI